MTINVNSGLIGLSVLGGTSNYASALTSLATSESPAVTRAKKAFTLPETTPPWDEDPDATSTNARISAIKKMLSLVDGDSDSSLADLPDVQAAFTTYKALERMRIIAESAAKTSTTATERATLQKIFAKGLGDLAGYIGSADTDQLALSFGISSSRAQTLSIQKSDVTASVTGQAVSTKQDSALAGLTGNEVFQLTLTSGTTTETVTVDLAQTTQPPTLVSVAAALNAAIGATPQRDANGDPVLDADGNVVSQWKSGFTIAYDSEAEKWGLVFKPSGIEKVAIDQVDAGDALLVASGETRKASTTDARIYRFEDLDGSLTWERLNAINAVDATATAQAEMAASGSDDEDTDYTVDAATSARAIVTDAEGFSYVVGTTAGDLGTNVADGADDLFLTKLDSEGKVVWQRSLGAAGSAQGAAISIAPNGEIVVAGTVSGAFSDSDDSQTDMLVARFSASGNELSATVVRQLGNETANALTVGDDGSIYVAGRSSTGGGDAFIVKLDATGTIQQRRTIDSGGNDLVTALAIDGSVNLLALTRENGETVVRQIDSSALASDLGSLSLGTAEARAIAVSDTGEIAIVGATTSAIGGTQVNAASGGRDAFLTRIDATLSNAATTYIGTASDDQADSVAWLGDTLYVGGRTTGTLGTARSGSVDGFIARIDGATGTVETVSQWGLAATTVEPVRLATVSGGSTALGALGLARGTLNQQTSATLVSQTSLRAGDQFTIKVDDGSTRTITIAADETMATLAQKLKRITGTSATITTPLVDGKSSLRIVVKTGHTLELGSGASGKDALGKLGLDPVRLVTPKVAEKDDPKVTPGGSYSLALSDALSLTDAKAAAIALKKIKSAISMIQSAYRSLYWDSTKTAIVDGTLSGGGGSAYQQKQLANYQAALSRLGG